MCETKIKIDTIPVNLSNGRDTEQIAAIYFQFHSTPFNIITDLSLDFANTFSRQHITNTNARITFYSYLLYVDDVIFCVKPPKPKYLVNILSTDVQNMCLLNGKVCPLRNSMRDPIKIFLLYTRLFTNFVL